jgi:hypothetical protein
MYGSEEGRVEQGRCKCVTEYVRELETMEDVLYKARTNK